ncbi:MAG: DUF4412 domain-containing protein, partial [Planctomycetota bacterium]|nr:DUF4412 domain-containing protein [Planctomycetota bacterium]
MRTFATFLVAGALVLHANATDTLITKRKITDTITAKGMEQPLQIQAELTWIGKDRLRVDVGNWSTIVRSDTKKLYQINHEARSYSVVDLPVDLKKYLTPEEAKKFEEMSAQITVSVTPTTETKKIQDWTATKYTMTMTVPKRGTFTEQIWAANDVGFDSAAWFELASKRSQLQPVGALMAAEQKKIVGFPLYIERTQTIGKNSFTGRDEVVSVECKDAPAGTFDLPQEYVEKPFELIDAAMKVRPPVEVEIIPIKPTPEKPLEKPLEKP